METSRRKFIQLSAAAAVGAWLPASAALEALEATELPVCRFTSVYDEDKDVAHLRGSVQIGSTTHFVSMELGRGQPTTDEISYARRVIDAELQKVLSR